MVILNSSSSSQHPQASVVTLIPALQRILGLITVQKGPWKSSLSLLHNVWSETRQHSCHQGLARNAESETRPSPVDSEPAFLQDPQVILGCPKVRGALIPSNSQLRLSFPGHHLCCLCYPVWGSQLALSPSPFSLMPCSPVGQRKRTIDAASLKSAPSNLGSQDAPALLTFHMSPGGQARL